VNRVPSPSPTPSSSQSYYHPTYYPHPSYPPERQATYHPGGVPGYPAAHGRMAIPLQGHPTIMAVNPPYQPGATPSPHDANLFGISPFPADNQYPPFGSSTQMPHMVDASTMMMASQHQVGSVEHFDYSRSLIHPQLQRTNTMPLPDPSTPYHLPPNYHQFNGEHQPIPGGSRPTLIQRHTVHLDHSCNAKPPYSNPGRIRPTRSQSQRTFSIISPL